MYPNFLNDVILDVRPSKLALRLLGTSWLLNDAVRAVLSRAEESHLQVLEICILSHVEQSDDTVSTGRILVSVGFRGAFQAESVLSNWRMS